MSKLPKLFFAVAAVFALVGMIWGIQMSASQDHTLSAAHGHLNLIGFVAMSIFGSFYALTPQAAKSPLAMLHFGMTILTVVVLVPGIVLAITGQTEMVAQVGSILAVMSMALFVFNVLRFGVGSPETGSMQGVVARSNPAE